MRAFLVFILPGIWVAVVLALEYAVPGRIQLAPLLAAAPAIACAGTGRRQCVLMAGMCALFALVPLRSEPGSDTGLGPRIGTSGAILAVAVASFVISRRRLRVQHDLKRVWAVADAAQRILLRPPRAEIGNVRTAARHVSGTAGPAISGTFHEVVDTPYGVRAVIGEARGDNDFDAVERASILLGAFREAAYDEPDVRDLIPRLDISLRRHLPSDVHQPSGPSPAPSPSPPPAALDVDDLWQISDVLTRPRPTTEAIPDGLTDIAVASIGPDGRLELVNRGLPAPYLIRSRTVSALDAAASSSPFGSGDSVLLLTADIALPLGEALSRLTDATPDEIVSKIRSTAVAAHVGDLALLLLRRAEDAPCY